jgi:uncharacterized protein with HEPN domain
MQHDVLIYLEDILSSIDAIENYTSTIDFEKYKSNRMIKRAVERELEIIGEAMNSILKLTEDIPITGARKIVDLRNVISHGYASVNDKLIWSILLQKIPVLKEEVQSYRLRFSV